MRAVGSSPREIKKRIPYVNPCENMLRMPSPKK